MTEPRTPPSPDYLSGPGGNVGELDVEDLHRIPASQPVNIRIGFLIMVSKLVRMTRLLSRCVEGEAMFALQECEWLAREIHRHEKALTEDILSSDASEVLSNELVRLAFRLARVGDLLETIVNCCRTRTHDAAPLGGELTSAMQQPLAVLVDMTSNLGDAVQTRNEVLLESIIDQAEELSALVRKHRSTWWLCRKPEPTAREETDRYLEILDASRSAGDYLGEICLALLELGPFWPAYADVSNTDREERSE